MKEKLRVGIVTVLVVGISLLNYHTSEELRHFHIFYRGLYFLPVMLASFWFGVRGGLATSLAICVLYIPYALTRWNSFSEMDFDRVIDIVLYNLVAIVMGTLSDRQRAHQRLAREAENLAAVGKAVAALAHDMKTPLIAIGGFSQLVKKYIRDDHPHHDKLDIVIEETRRLESMVMDMLDFSRPLELIRLAEDINSVVKECLEVVAAEAQKRNVKIRCEPAPGLSAVAIDRMRMKQMLINLIMNAIQASSEGETVTVRSYQTRSKHIVEVIDCGRGIPSDQRDEIFTPFFSTKKEGTGLGLSIVRKVVEAHQGKIQVLDNLKRGTIFRIVIPIR
jgi:two-component system, NtrC family, sensor histidine kinase HydH